MVSDGRRGGRLVDAEVVTRFPRPSAPRQDGRARTPPPRRRRRRTVAAAVVGGVLVLLLAADAGVGAMIGGGIRCTTDTGLALSADAAALPLTSGLLTGSSGRVDLEVDWAVVSQRLAGTAGTDLSLGGDAGDIVAEATVAGNQASIRLAASADDGDLVLEPVSLEIAGMSVPVDLARSLGGQRASQLLQQRRVELDELAGQQLPLELRSVEVEETGLQLRFDVPPDALIGAALGGRGAGSAVPGGVACLR